MYSKLAAVTIGIFLFGCVTTPIIGNGANKARVIRHLEANSDIELAQEMHPKALETLVKLYTKGTIQASDITRYGAYLGRFQDLKALFYDAVEWTEISESAVHVGEFFILTSSNDPLQNYGRHLHALEPAERSRIDEIVWNENFPGVNRRRTLATYLRQLRLFDNELDLQSFMDAVFVAYIHSHLWAEESTFDWDSLDFPATTTFEVILGSRIHYLLSRMKRTVESAHSVNSKTMALSKSWMPGALKLRKESRIRAKECPCARVKSWSFPYSRFYQKPAEV